jgi:hypothetical protein
MSRVVSRYRRLVRARIDSRHEHDRKLSYR